MSRIDNFMEAVLGELSAQRPDWREWTLMTGEGQPYQRLETAINARPRTFDHILEMGSVEEKITALQQMGNLPDGLQQLIVSGAGGEAIDQYIFQLGFNHIAAQLNFVAGAFTFDPRSLCSVETNGTIVMLNVPDGDPAHPHFGFSVDTISEDDRNAVQSMVATDTSLPAEDGSVVVQVPVVTDNSLPAADGSVVVQVPVATDTSLPAEDGSVVVQVPVVTDNSLPAADGTVVVQVPVATDTSLPAADGTVAVQVPVATDTTIPEVATAESAVALSVVEGQVVAAGTPQPIAPVVINPQPINPVQLGQPNPIPPVQLGQPNPIGAPAHPGPQPIGQPPHSGPNPIVGPIHPGPQPILRNAGVQGGEDVSVAQTLTASPTPADAQAATKNNGVRMV
jgi:hypothetical protein